MAGQAEPSAADPFVSILQSGQSSIDAARARGDLRGAELLGRVQSILGLIRDKRGPEVLWAGIVERVTLGIVKDANLEAAYAIDEDLQRFLESDELQDAVFSPDEGGG